MTQVHTESHGVTVNLSSSEALKATLNIYRSKRDQIQQTKFAWSNSREGIPVYTFSVEC